MARGRAASRWTTISPAAASDEPVSGDGRALMAYTGTGRNEDA
jgi:hypothetical protein